MLLEAAAAGGRRQAAAATRDMKFGDNDILAIKIVAKWREEVSRVYLPTYYIHFEVSRQIIATCKHKPSIEHDGDHGR